jgi:ribosomal protein S8
MTIFIKFGVIKKIKRISKSYYLIILKYFNKKPIFKIKLLKKQSQISMSNVNLKKLCLKKNVIWIVASSSKIISNYELMNKKIGGFVLGKLHV